MGSRGDDPGLSVQKEISVKDGDIIVLATDGLLDNLHLSQIIDVLV